MNMRASLRSVIIFLIVFGALQAIWTSSAGVWIERLWVEGLTVPVATLVLNALNSDLNATAEGSRIIAPGGGLNILQGCDGIDAVFILIAGFAAVSMGFQRRMAGMLMGLLFVFVLNQLRILALFTAFRNDRQLFNFLHTSALPLMLVVLTALFFHYWIGRGKRSEPEIRAATQSVAK